MKSRLLLNLVLSMLVIVSCARSATHPAKRISEAQAETFNVKGEVLWKGVTPVVYPIPTTAYHGACGKRRADWAMRLKMARVWHKRLLDVAVWLEPVWEEMSPEDIRGLKAHQKVRWGEPVQIFQKGCEFEPSLIVIPVGSTIEVFNKDRKDHWLVIEGKYKKREQYVQYYGERPSVFTFETPEVHHIPQGVPVSLKADNVDIWHLASGFHRWMDAWVVITDKIWFDSEVDEKGIFEITDVPRGVYRVCTWHPLLGENSSIVRVPDEARKLVAVDYNEVPYKFEEVPSTIITTTGEVREDHQVWQDIDESF